MLNVVKYNFDQGQKNFWLWEIGKTYFVKNPANAESSGVIEERHLSACIFGSVNNEIWNKKDQNDFYTIKGVLESIFAEFKLSNRIIFNEIEKEDGLEFLHPAQSAKVQLLGKSPVTIGYLGKVHPSLNNKMKLNQDLFIFEINLEEILNAVNLHTVKYKKLPQFGYVQRDIAFAINKERKWEEIEKIIKKSADKNIYRGVQVFDIYEGENIEHGKKSMAVRVTLQDENATLKDEIIESEIAKIKKSLQNSISEITLR
jgi:phenylalanyl-tRNA synthetase beta chain